MNRPEVQRPNFDWKYEQKKCYFNGSRVDCISHCNYVRTNYDLHWHFDTWCNYYPTNCHWWYDWCGPSYYFDPSCCINYSWYYCPVEVIYQGVVQRYSWHLGVNCVYIPGKGLGIQEVEAGSPADLVGLEPGMVILQADGFDLVDEATMPSIIQGSGGLLNLTVVTGSDAELFSVDVQMAKLVSAGY